MIRSIALIHLISVLHSQMARISNRRRRQPKQRPETVRHVDHPSYPLAATKRGKTAIHPRQPQGHMWNTQPLSSGTEGRITLRLTRRPYGGSGHEQRVCWTTPRVLLEPQDDQGRDGAIAKEKDREDWLRRLRPRPPRVPAFTKRKSSRRRKTA